MVVGNCHKQPESLFTRQLLTVEEIVTEWECVLVELRKVNPSLKILFTVSPIPHSKDGMNGNQKQAVENMLKQFSATNQNRNYDQFWSIYNKEKQDIITAVNRGALDRYTPMQIRISIENALKKLNSISVIGCEGYTKMKKIAGRKI